MALSTWLVIGVYATVVAGAVLRSEDVLLSRLVRSPGEPPASSSPSPPVVRTQQWSGVSRSKDGQGVISSAAATINGDAPTDSQAFSLASTAVGAGTAKGTVAPELASRFGGGFDNFGQSADRCGGYGGQSAGYGGGERVSGGKSSFKESHFSYQSAGGEQFGHDSGNGYQGSGRGDELHRHHHHHSHGHGRGFDASGQFQGGHGGGSSSHSSSFASSGGSAVDAGSAIHFDDNNSGYRGEDYQQGQKNSGSGYGSSSKSSAYSRNEQQQLQYGSERGFDSGAGGGGAVHGSAGSYEAGGAGYGSQNAQYGQSGSGSGYDAYGRNNGFPGGEQQRQQLQQVSQSGYESAVGSDQQGYISGAGSSSSSQSSSASGAYGSHKSHGDLHTGLGGALQLASQGLQQAQEQNGACSTCGKSSYALSNAKSHSGSAIALSVAG